jgi:hypothetical protein
MEFHFALSHHKPDDMQMRQGEWRLFLFQAKQVPIEGARGLLPSFSDGNGCVL